jgi:hypothetical protein
VRGDPGGTPHNQVNKWARVGGKYIHEELTEGTIWQIPDISRPKDNLGEKSEVIFCVKLAHKSSKSGFLAQVYVFCRWHRVIPLMPSFTIKFQKLGQENFSRNLLQGG